MESEGEAAIIPEGDNFSNELTSEYCERENELVQKLNDVHEKLEEEIQHRKALEDLIYDMRRSFHNQKQIIDEKVSAI